MIMAVWYNRFNMHKNIGILSLIVICLVTNPVQAVILELPANAPIQDQIAQLNARVNQKKQDLDKLNTSIETYKSLIAQKASVSASLTDEINLFDNRIRKNQLAAELANDQLDQLKLEIENLDDAIDGTDVRLDQDRELLAKLVRNLYNNNFRHTAIESIFSSESFSEAFQKSASLIQLQNSLDETADNVKNLRSDLKNRQSLRAGKAEQVAKQKAILEKNRAELAVTVELKKNILSQTKSSEQEYRNLVAELKKQQKSADSEIVYLERSLRDKQGLSNRLGSGDTVLTWPVSPARGITTRFRDPEYPFRYVFEHPGLDIRSAQGSPVRSSSGGVVARAKNGGARGYSYVMILHNNGFSTVYGHLSRITAVEGATVARGEIIGYSGGMPGTVGAGPLTTGPHLHFELRRNGVPVDPMKFLVNG